MVLFLFLEGTTQCCVGVGVCTIRKLVVIDKVVVVFVAVVPLEYYILAIQLLLCQRGWY